MSRHDLTDEQWRLLEPLLPTSSRRGRPRQWPLRGLVDGVRFRFRVGCLWRDVPERYGPWWRVYALFPWWHLLGIWNLIEKRLLAAADAADKLDWQVSVDSPTARAHAAGARGDSDRRIPEEPVTMRWVGPGAAGPCMYGRTADHKFVVGRVGDRLSVGGGCNGHGFKHAAAIGEHLAEIALGLQPTVPMAFADATRFAE